MICSAFMDVFSTLLSNHSQRLAWGILPSCPHFLLRFSLTRCFDQCLTISAAFNGQLFFNKKSGI